MNSSKIPVTVLPHFETRYWGESSTGTFLPDYIYHDIRDSRNAAWDAIAVGAHEASYTISAYWGSSAWAAGTQIFFFQIAYIH